MSTASSVSVFSKVIGDCQALGYNVTSLCVDPNSSYVPPAASSDTSKRLVALVTGTFTIYGKTFKDFHFYMQNSDGTSWSHKPGVTEARTTCTVHTSVTLTNSNICQHIHCGGYESTVIMFYIDAPGITDRWHLDGINKSPYVTKTEYCEDAGGILKCAKALPSVSYLSKTGYINHRGDVDYFIFDVTSLGSHRIEILTSTEYIIYLQFTEVSNINYVSFNTEYASSPSSTISLMIFMLMYTILLKSFLTAVFRKMQYCTWIPKSSLNAV